MGLRLTAWLPQVATAKGGANGEADIVSAVGQQVAEEVSIHPVGGEPDADSPRYVEVNWHYGYTAALMDVLRFLGREITTHSGLLSLLTRSTRASITSAVRRVGMDDILHGF
jgi:hypothetical protein